MGLADVPLIRIGGRRSGPGGGVSKGHATREKSPTFFVQLNAIVEGPKKKPNPQTPKTPPGGAEGGKTGLGCRQAREWTRATSLEKRAVLKRKGNSGAAIGEVNRPRVGEDIKDTFYTRRGVSRRSGLQLTRSAVQKIADHKRREEEVKVRECPAPRVRWGAREISKKRTKKPKVNNIYLCPKRSCSRRTDRSRVTGWAATPIHNKKRGESETARRTSLLPQCVHMSAMTIRNYQMRTKKKSEGGDRNHGDLALTQTTTKTYPPAK